MIRRCVSGCQIELKTCQRKNWELSSACLAKSALCPADITAHSLLDRQFPFHIQEIPLDMLVHMLRPVDSISLKHKISFFTLFGREDFVIPDQNWSAP